MCLNISVIISRIQTRRFLIPGVRRPLRYNLTTAHDEATEITQNNINVLIISNNQNLIDEIIKLANTLWSLTVEVMLWWRHILLNKELEPSDILDLLFLRINWTHSILIKTRVNRGNRDRKCDLCIKVA